MSSGSLQSEGQGSLQALDLPQQFPRPPMRRPGNNQGPLSQSPISQSQQRLRPAFPAIVLRFQPQVRGLGVRWDPEALTY